MWIAGKLIQDEFVYKLTETTSASSGNFFVTNKAGTFYLSYTGYGEENAFASVKIHDWTNCTEVFIGLVGRSGNHVLSGAGAYFDNFKLTYDLDIVCKEDVHGDLNDDCKVDFTDFVLMANNWLVCNLDPPSACWE